VLAYKLETFWQNLYSIVVIVEINAYRKVRQFLYVGRFGSPVVLLAYSASLYSRRNMQAAVAERAIGGKQ
jgi:hypothetical protein